MVEFHALTLDEIQTTDYDRPADRSFYTEQARKERDKLDPRTNGPFLDDVHDAHNAARRRGKALEFVTELGKAAQTLRESETAGDREAANINLRDAGTHDPEAVTDESNPNVRPKKNQTFSKQDTSESEKRQEEAEKNAKKNEKNLDKSLSDPDVTPDEPKPAKKAAAKKKTSATKKTVQAATKADSAGKK